MRKHELLSCLWLFGSLLKTEHMGKPWNNESAEKWWACGRHARQKELAPSAKDGAPHDARGRACAAPTPPRPSQVLREQEGVRAGYAELQSKPRATYGDSTRRPAGIVKKRREPRQ